MPVNVQVRLIVNGTSREIATPPQRSLLEVLREEFNLTGTKYGCGEGQCRACTVLVDGRPVRACQTEIAEVQGATVETIENLAKDGRLHPVQQAFLDEEAMQCGYCVPGMILTTVALLRRDPNPSETEIVRALNGNLCRCCGYPNILKAIRRAAGAPEEEVAP